MLRQQEGPAFPALVTFALHTTVVPAWHATCTASGMANVDQEGIAVDREHVRELIDRVRGFSRPVVSMYATVHPGQPQTLSRAVVVRAKNTVRDLEGVSAGVRQRLVDFFEKRAPQGRSVAVFADENEITAIELDLALGQDGDGDRFDTRVGEPYFTPLLAAVNEYAPHLVLLVDLDHVRAYRIFLGQAHLMHEATREATAMEQDEIGSSIDRFPHAVTRGYAPSRHHPHTAGNQQNGPKYVADRGDAARQLADERIERSQAAFYREQAEILQPFLQQHAIERVLIAGPERDRHLMQASMPSEIAKHVSALIPGLDGEEPAPHRVLQLAQAKIEELEAARDVELVNAIAERGVQGVEQCLEALQAGRLHQLAVPLSWSQEAYVDPQTEYVTAKRQKAAALNGNGVQKVDLSVLLPELAEKWGAHLEFVRGEAERRVIDEFGGLGGLARW